MNRILERLREPSTAAGVAAVALLAGQSMEAAQAIANAVAAAAGLLAIILPERRP